MRSRRRQRSWLLAATFAVSAALHPLLAVVYEESREPRLPRLFVDVDGEGSGVVHAVREASGEGLTCDENCELSAQPGEAVRLVATVSEGSTFEGWTGACGPQGHRLFRWAQRLVLRSDAELTAERAALVDFLAVAAEPTPSEWPLECVVTLDASTRVTATFGTVPDEVQVDWVAMNEPSEPDPDVHPNPELTVTLPDPELEAENLFDPEELLEELPEEVPELEVEPPIVEEPPPPSIVESPPPEPVKAPAPQPPPPSKMTAVEVPDENEVEEAPDDATFLSDKNRDVAEETHARDTNLEKQSDGEVVASEKSDIESEQIGASETEIAELEETEMSSLEVDRAEETAHSGKEEIARGVRGGDEGQDGEDGEGGDDTPAEKKGLLSMRGIEGRGMPGGPSPEDGRGEAKVAGDGGARGKPGKSGRAGLETQLAQADYERIVGTEVAENEREVARRVMSKRRGRWEKKLGAIKSSLENFTPEVRPGNQTALKTRAAPFAVYIARMHRRIHKLWGFGFLEDLDGKSSSSEMNDWSLWTKLEIVINADGSVDKMTIVKPSGVLTFDVAAMDAVYTSGPFEPPPAAIRSGDGKVYMHWAFHRDWHQCGTFGAQPFILDNPSSERDRGAGMNDSDILGMPTRKSAADTASPEAAAATARATSNMPAPDDPRAAHVANLFLSGFATGNLDKLVKISKAPFRSGGVVVGNTEADIRGVYRNVLAESTSRRIREWKVLSAAGYRQKFGALPPGADEGKGELMLVVRVASERLTLILRPDGDGYKIVGLER